MKIAHNMSSNSFRALAFAAASVLAVGQGGCLFGSGTPKQTMRSSSENTSGEGTVQANVGPNGNTELEVRVKHLSPPGKVEADASVYVVWVKPHNANIQNIGALRIDDDLVGKFNASTPHRSFTLMVTPEPSARMSEPTHKAVFTTDVNSKE